MANHQSKPEYLGKRMPALQEQFLELFRENCSITESCNHLKLKSGKRFQRCYVYKWKRLDKTFNERFENAREEAVDKLEHKVWGRAVDGVEEITYHENGNVKSVKVKYSDMLARVLLMAHRPEKYSDKIAVKVEKSVDHDVVRELQKSLMKDGSYVEYIQGRASRKENSDSSDMA